MYFVNYLLNSRDNIIDQLKLLKKYSDCDDVKIYINDSLLENFSPYYRYCILKYYFDLDIPEVKRPLPKLYFYEKGFEDIEELISTTDNIIDALKLLKNNNKNKRVVKFIKLLEKGKLNPYEKYCIDKYYYELDVDEVKPPNITLVHTYFHKLEDAYQEILNEQFKYLSKNIQVGDKVVVLDFPFQNMPGIVKKIDFKTRKFIVEIILFEIETEIEIERCFKTKG